MSLAMADRPETARDQDGQRPVRGDHLYCRKCHRWLTERRVLVGLAPGTVFARVNCKWCKAERWFDLATGEPVDAPPSRSRARLAAN